jgi:tetratricopeptide (TPR) repeat protein
LRRQQGLALSERLKLSRAALARLHFMAGQWWRAVAQCQSVLATDPARADVRLLLAEALWRGGQRQEAAQVCQDLLADLPHCLKANLMRGTILVATDQSGAEVCFAIAQALDPENLVAQELLGPESPLRVREVGLELEDEASESEGLPAAPEPDEAWSTKPVEPRWRRALRRLVEKR